MHIPTQVLSNAHKSIHSLLPWAKSPIAADSLRAAPSRRAIRAHFRFPNVGYAVGTLRAAPCRQRRILRLLQCPRTRLRRGLQSGRSATQHHDLHRPSLEALSKYRKARKRSPAWSKSSSLEELITLSHPNCCAMLITYPSSIRTETATKAAPYIKSSSLYHDGK